MKLLFDTTVYIHCLRSRAYFDQFQAEYRPRRPQIWLSAVVVHELYAGARDRTALQLVDELLHGLEQAGRVVTPTYQEWKEAGHLRSELEAKRPAFRTKARPLMADFLIALSARRIGARLLTHNADDFTLIRRLTPFSLEVLVESAR